MRRIHRSALVPYSAEAMFALVDAVEAYPEFLPWCVGAEVQSRTASERVATLRLGYGALNTAFTTRNEVQPPDWLSMRFVDGPFRALQGRWQFEPIGAVGCEVTLDMQFEFASRAQDMLLGPAFETICNELIDAFIKRAEVLYAR